jgi:CDP-diacylglycerol--serine O-phosphatidyltransferase
MASIRLARYNVEHSDEATPYFRGLPSPGAAAVVCAWIFAYHHYRPQLIEWGLVKTSSYSGLMNLDLFGWAIIAMSVLAALLMVSTVRYPHVGNTLLGRISFRKLILGLVVVSLLVTAPAATLFVATTGYVLWGCVGGMLEVFRNWQRGRSPLADEDDDEAEDAGLGREREPPSPGPAHGR